MQLRKKTLKLLNFKKIEKATMLSLIITKNKGTFIEKKKISDISRFIYKNEWFYFPQENSAKNCHHTSLQ